jgi:hypothetical protein
MGIGLDCPKDNKIFGAFLSLYSGRPTTFAGNRKRDIGDLHQDNTFIGILIYLPELLGPGRR